MKHQAAYAILYLNGTAPTMAEVEAFMRACGISVDKEQLARFFACMDGRDYTNLINEGQAKMAAMNAPAAVAVAEPVAPEAVPEELAVAAKPSEQPEDNMNLGGIFGDDEYGNEY